jgi:proline iminopeptidase
MRKKLHYSFIIFLFILSICNAQKTKIIGEHYYNVNGIRIYSEIIGHGAPIIILHGGPGLDHTYLLPQFQELSKYHKLIFYDQRGSGKSGGKVDSLSITIDNFISDLEGLRKALHIQKMNLFGHSWGTLLGMYYACRYPEHVKSIILANTMGATSEFLLPFITNRESRRTSKDSAAILQIMSSNEFIKRDPAVMDKFARIFFRSYFLNQSLADSLTLSFNNTTAQNLLTIFNLFGKFLSNYNIREKLKKLNCPVLIIHGDYDPIPLKYAAELNSIIKGSKFVVLKNCGHFSFVEAPETLFTECESFLTKNQF